MKFLSIFLIAIVLLIGGKSVSNAADEVISCGPEATCYGNNPCTACKTCNYCKHCNSGGSCGICASTKKKTETKKPVTSFQCKATTKKETRCSRTASSTGYCWQH